MFLLSKWTACNLNLNRLLDEARSSSEMCRVTHWENVQQTDTTENVLMG